MEYFVHELALENSIISWLEYVVYGPGWSRKHRWLNAPIT